MICGSCGTNNEAGRKFCGECGARLAAICPSCGTVNAPTSKFCGECATPLVAGASPGVAVPGTAGPLGGTPAQGGPIQPPQATGIPFGARPAGYPAPPSDGGFAFDGARSVSMPIASNVPVAERRLVSILFADLVGFTTLAEGRDAEDTRELLSHYFDLSRDVIARYGGTVEKFIGDAVMAVWGAPTAHEDDAERAVRAALELVDAVQTLGPGIAARVGVLTGEAAVTIGATNQGMVAGDLVNTASRLQSVAAPGTVLVGEATERAASRAIAFEAAGEQVLKGKTAPVPAWRALRVIAQTRGRNRSETLEAPFVGRDDEFRLVKDLFHSTLRERRARLVSVIGAAGIGKSRLAWEFAKYRDGIVETVLYHEGRSPAYGDGISFWALGEMVRRRAGLLETDDEGTTRTKVAASVAEHVPDEAERRWIEPALLALLGIGTGAIASDELFAAWRTFFERMAMTDPVVMVFEDFHHADSGLIDFVDHLLEWSRSFPIYVLTLARPELIQRRPEWGAGKRSFTSIFLEPLQPDAMRELLAGLVPGLPEHAQQAIVARADGVPLYAVETVRMLLSEGKLTLDGGVYRPSGDLTTLAVPETLTALIASRLDALDPGDRTLAADAAVLGQSFTLEGLSFVSGLDPDELAARLLSLTSHEILRLETDPRSPERGQYAFVQALIREVAYNALAKRDRKARHLAAARFFESLETEEIAGGLAGHYLAAFHNSAEGPEADAVAAQARLALTAAAQRATDLGSQAQALAFLEQALTVTTDPGDTARLLERAGDVAALAGRHDIAERHLRDAMERQRSLGDRVAVASATTALARALIAAYHTSEAIAILAPALEEFADLAATPTGIALGSQLARAYFLHDQNAEALALTERVLPGAERADLPGVVADTLITKGTALAILGRPVEGRGAVRAGMDLAEAHGFGTTVVRANNNIAFLEAAYDPRAALQATRAGLALARRLGIRSWIAGFLQNLGEFGLRTGDWTAGIDGIEPGLGEDWDPIDRCWLLIGLVPLRALRGDDVSDAVAELERMVADHDDPQAASNVDAAIAWVKLARGDLAEARRRMHRAGEVNLGIVPTQRPRAARVALWSADVAGAKDDLAAADATGLHGGAVDADRRTVRAGILASEGNVDEAMVLYREALRSWRDLGLRWDEALCGLDMAWLLDPSDPEVAAAAATSREILEGLGAASMVARLDAAVSRSEAASGASGRASASLGAAAPLGAFRPAAS